MFDVGDLVKTNELDIISIGIVVGIESWNSVFKSILEDDEYFEENIEENHSEIFTLSILENNVVRDVDYNITEIGSFISLIRKL
jgi:hypothetical protein